ncbi:MAG: DMT family transporter [Oscillospiraceae bacterium]|nr:DMT family transporter [Oscillospiraceae bacterium]
MSNKTKGIIFIITSALCFAFMNMFVRLAGDVPSVQKSFFRNSVACIFAAAVLLRSEEKFRFDKKNLPDLIGRSVFGTIGILCNFYAIDHLPLADASMLNKLSPFFAIIFSYFLLKEKMTLVQILSVITAFIGVIFIIKPAGISIDQTLSACIGTLGGMGAGLAYTFVRKMSGKERGAFIVFFFSAFSCLVTLPYFIFNYSPMTLNQTIILILAGLSAAGGQFTITAAYSHAPAKEISVFDYTQIIFVSLIGFIVFNEIPDIFSVIGYIIICTVGIIMFFYGNKK